jgi:hypothetical protein
MNSSHYSVYRYPFFELIILNFYLHFIQISLNIVIYQLQTGPVYEE